MTKTTTLYAPIGWGKITRSFIAASVLLALPSLLVAQDIGIKASDKTGSHIDVLTPAPGNVAEFARIRVSRTLGGGQNALLTIEAEIDAATIRMASQQRITLTPVLVSADKKQQHTLPAVMINGSIRHKVYRRAQVLGYLPKAEASAVSAVLRAGVSDDKPYTYSTDIPLQPWMRGATLILRREITGCAECGMGQDDYVVAGNMFPPVPAPVAKCPTYPVMPIESHKVRTEKHVAHLNYRQARHDLLPHFGSNATELAAIDSVMRELKNNPTLRIKGFEIRGYASPEGQYDYNIALSKRRSHTFKDYISKTYSYPANMFAVKWYGEDWDGLREWVITSSLPNKEQVLAIIDNIPIKEGREKQLMDLDGGNTYRHLLSTVFPTLRRSEEYIVDLEIRPYTIDEARRVMLTHPSRLSLNEFATVAKACAENDVAGRTAVWQIAADTYPKSPEAQIALGVSLYNQGKYDDATRIARPLISLPEGRSLLAAALIKEKRYKEALHELTPYADMAPLCRDIEAYLSDTDR